ALKTDNEIKSLPGLSNPINFKQYSGYLDIGDGKHFFYWLTESQTAPESAPVVLWLNGGPGCSSLFGNLRENGPFRVNSDGKTLTLNPSSWNSVANVVYFESPVSVGFSYKEDKKYNNTDQSTTVDNHLALEEFFKKYPNLMKNPFYITGESYAGIYIPMLAKEILSRNSSINLKGVAIGNGFLDSGTLGGQHSSDLFLGHGFITTDYYEKKIENCCQCKTGQCSSVPYEGGFAPNPYNIYDDCDPSSAYIRLYNKYYAKKSNRPPIIASNRDKDCPHNGYEDYLNVPEVRKALHVRPEDTHEWYDCGGSYSGSATDQHQTVHQLLDVYKIGKLVIFNGNFDSVCDHIANQRFVDSLNLRKLSDYSSWVTPDGTIGGFVQHYEKGLSYVLVRGAGHMVPHDKPEAALQMLKNVIGISINICIALILYFCVVFAANEDEIKSLPGLSDPINFKQYSGYLDIGDGKHYFYWLAESQTAPESAPVVLWLNGGPGCSSLFGNLGENGPFRVNSDGKTLALNPSSWNSVANVVYFESPVSVGFSYKEDKQYHNTDESTAVDNHLALEAFFKKFPDLKKNPFYISGESYAGIYIPMLAQQIFKTKSTINLKGVLIGNGYLDLGTLGGQHSTDLRLGHGLVTTDYYEQKIENCCECKTGEVMHAYDFSK
ncbi:unnamed protein product, partial [Medioppia subpectinata]